MSFYADLDLTKIRVWGNISTGDVLSKDLFFVRRRVINKATYNTAIRDFLLYSEIEATLKKRYFPIISPNI